MAIQKRSNLLQGENWEVVYQAFSVINLTAYDYTTVRQSMIDYLRINFGDQFNDWSANSELMFIIDTLSFLAQNLAFRMDLNTRENFLDTAERRTSVIKLARMISYSPRRSYPARAIAKLTEVKTTQDIVNSSGRSLKNVPIRWNDPMDDDWQENFFLVLNNSFISSNKYGKPIKKYINSDTGISYNVYRLNTVPLSSPSLPFNANVNGESMQFEVVNPDLDDNGFIIERHPEPMMQQHVLYCNDGNGFESPNTGFFVYFKQGTLSKSDFYYQQATENRIQDINVDNINELDVWVQEITEDGSVRTKWTKVPAMESIAYTSVNRKVKNIFSVTTRENDQISIKFPDSRSGDLPRGSFRYWYRVSNGKTYIVKTTDIQNKSVQYRYRADNQSQFQDSTLDIKFSLQYQDQSAQTKETLEQIKERAPQLYYTQNRFVNGEDYNIAPLMLGNTVLKAKAINRIYSGQSRFIDINDPTGKYQNTDVFSDDGGMYRESENASETRSVLLPTTKSNQAIVIDNIQPLISSNMVIQRYQEYPDHNYIIDNVQNWTPEFSSKYPSNSYGRLVQNGNTFITYEIGTLIKFTDGIQTLWSSVINVDGNYLILSQSISSGWRAINYMKPFRLKFNTSEVQQISKEMDRKRDFSLYYDTADTTWKTIDGVYDTETVLIGTLYYPIFVKCIYTAESWNFISKGIEYIFVGGSKVKFYFVSKNKISDISSGNVNTDKIDVLSYNSNSINNNGYNSNIDFQIIDTLVQENGYLDGSRAIITSSDLDSNGIPLSPNQFRDIVPSWSGTDDVKYNQWIILKTNQDFTISYVDVNSNFTLLDSTWTYNLGNANSETNAYKKDALTRNVNMRSTTINDLYNKASGFVIGFEYNGTSYFVQQVVNNNNDRLQNFISNMTLPSDTTAITPELAFYRAITNMGSSDATETQKLDYYGYENVSTEYVIKKDARVNINYHWKHYAPDDNRIDPSKTNLMDMYVLTNSYKEEVQLWINRNDGSEFPKPPTSTELKNMFSDVETKTVVSDSLIWHSAKYLPLFGNSAADDYKANFKVVRIPNTTLSDDEIRQTVVSLINKFFDISGWDFGDRFYYTELATYIQSNMRDSLASIVLVPQNQNSKFGEMFEIPSEADQIFVSTATVDNIIIVNSLAKSNINIGN